MATKTALQVVQDFMQALTKHTYTSSTKNLGTAMLDDAVKASTSFSGIQNALDNFKSDQIEAERIAVEEVLGSGYAGMLMSQVNGVLIVSKNPMILSPILLNVAPKSLTLSTNA